MRHPGRKSRAEIGAELLNKRLHSPPPRLVPSPPPYEPPPPPRDLPAEEQALWRDIAARYKVDVISAAIHSHATWREMNAAVRRQGVTVETTQGNLKPHPGIAVGAREFRAYRDAIRQLKVKL